MGSIHEFFYDNKWLGVLIFLAGMTYAGYLYLRAYGRWAVTRGKGNDTRLREHLQEHTSKHGSEASRLVHPPAEDEGQQEDLLSRLAREDEDELPAGAPTQRGTRDDLQSDPAHRSTHILRGAGTDVAAPESDTEGDERTPLQNAIRAAVEESLREDDEQLGEEAAQRSDAFEAMDATPANEDALTGRVVTTEGASVESPEADAAPAAEPAPRQRRSSSPEDAHRIASRHEELGLHREVHADKVADPAIRRITDEDRKRRLSQLGIALDADTVESAEERRARLGTDELDDILGRLDAALAETGDEPAAPTPPAKDEVPPANDEVPPAAAVASFFDGLIEDEQATSAEDAPAADEDVVLGDERSTTVDADGADEQSEQQPERTEAEASAADEDEREAIPDWARADTFDDDEPDGPGAEQQKLF